MALLFTYFMHVLNCFLMIFICISMSQIRGFFACFIMGTPKTVPNFHLHQSYVHENGMNYGTKSLK